MRENVEGACIKEGSVSLHLSEKVFYNPKMKINRDLSVAVASLRKPREYLDALSATGVLGLRVAKETGINVVLNDRSRVAYELIRKNAELNNLPCRIFNQDANVLLHSRHFDFVDLDPFGSPSPFLSSASRSVLGSLAVTATDTAPLCGAHSSGRRKYDAFPLKTEYHPEMGVRILLGKIIRELAARDKGGIPFLSIAKSHFIRCWVKIKKGAREADGSLRNLGYIFQCKCGYRSHRLHSSCPLCSSPGKNAGPLYTGRIHEPGFCKRVLLEIEKRNPDTRKELLRIISLCRDELLIPYHYDLHNICKKLKVSPPPMDEWIEKLRTHGFAASRTHFSGTSFKTDADVREIRALL
jgi:tRNA (guanine26-N2/guanine27-N2)-dimethyltransferase